MTNLLKKAQAAKLSSRGNFNSSQDIELALAWARREVTHKQVCDAYKIPNAGGQAYVRLAAALAAHIRNVTKKV